MRSIDDLKTRQLARESILLAIESIKGDILEHYDAADTKVRAEAILILAKAFREVGR